MSFEAFRIRPITEDDIEGIVVRAGGRRAHPDADRRDDRGADFIIGDVVIELKQLDEDGLDKPERQQKLAALFREHDAERPVVVVDRGRLPPEGQLRYDRVLEGPIKKAVASSRGQLKQSRLEIPDSKASVLFMINNGYTALNQDELMALVARRVRNDSSEIDGVIVGGCYFYSDTFDSFFLWPLHYVPVRIDRCFEQFDALKEAWDNFADGVMTELMVEGHGRAAVKGPVVDAQFDVDGVTFVKPSPPMGNTSEFFIHGRPRANSSGLTQSPSVGLTFPGLSRTEWTRLHDALAGTPELQGSFEGWMRLQTEATKTGKPNRPLVVVPITADGWTRWCSEQKRPRSMRAVRDYANAVFQKRITSVLEGARLRTTETIVPERYMLVVTEEIGQDKANDVSHIAMVREYLNGETQIRPVLENVRMFHEQAVTLASAHAVAEGLGTVFWQKDQTYCWS